MVLRLAVSFVLFFPFCFISHHFAPFILNTRSACGRLLFILSFCLKWRCRQKYMLLNRMNYALLSILFKIFWGLILSNTGNYNLWEINFRFHHENSKWPSIKGVSLLAKELNEIFLNFQLHIFGFKRYVMLIFKI